jgi:hypothetical protein
MPHWGGVGDSKWLELDRSSSLWEAPCGGQAGWFVRRCGGWKAWTIVWNQLFDIFLS